MSPPLTRVLALHGWMDNAASFDRLGEQLASHGAEVIAVDFAGHGESPHRAPYVAVDYALDVVDFVHDMGWDDGAGFVLMGHSMGGGIACLAACVLGEHLKSLVLLEGLGLLPRPPSFAPEALRAASEARRSRSRTPKVYATIEDAVNARIRTSVNSPGDQRPMDASSAEAIVNRSLRRCDGGFSFTHDVRFKRMGRCLFVHFKECVF